MKICITIAALFVMGAATSIAQTSSQPAPAKPPIELNVAAPDKPAQPKIDPAKEADIRLLMEVNGSKAVIVETVSSMLTSMRPLMTQAMPPGDYREKLIDLFFAKFQTKIDVNQFIQIAIPAYDKNFSHDEIKGLIAFYQSPIGQKTVSTLPKLMSELREAGQQWGRQVGQDSMKEVLAEHPEMEAALEAAAKDGKAN
jgi:hypothetical protein